jgi:DNA replication protein DnaC
MRKSASIKCIKCQDTGFILEDSIARECECLKRERASNAWKRFGVNPEDVKQLNQYKPYDETTREARDKAVEYIKNYENFRRTHAVRENGFALLGQPGSGKSHIIIAIGAALLNSDNSVSAVYMPYLEAMRELKANVMDDEYYIKLLGKYQTAELLIIDDLFKDKMKNGSILKDRYGNSGLTEADMKHIYPILNYRYLNYLPTIVSSECTPEILLELDEALARRLLEPAGNNIVVFRGQDYNYSMKKYRRG